MTAINVVTDIQNNKQKTKKNIKKKIMSLIGLYEHI